MNIIPRFSFTYDGEPFDVSDANVTPTDYGFLYELSDGLCIELHRRDYPAYNAVGWTLWFENKSKTDSGLIQDVCDCDIPFWFGDENGEKTRVSVFDTAGNLSYETYRHANQVAREFEVTERALSHGESLCYRPRGGRSSSYRMPFFDLYTSGRRGLIVAVGWSGQWQASFSHLDGETVQVKTGLEYTAFKLHPGERIRTSSVILLEYSGTQMQGSNLFRRLVKYELCPYTPDRFPFALEGMGMPTKKHLYHLERFKKHGVKADYYWIDAGWYGKGGAAGASEWYKQVGNWQVRPDEHPDGLLDVVKAVNGFGMDMLLWMEPERVYPGTDIAVAHPEWLYPTDGFYILLRLDLDEVREYLFDLICGFIDRLNIKCFRQDFNMEPLQSWRITDEMYRGGINEIKYIMNLYRLWDDLRKKYPDLIIDNCASGGRRIDIETLQRSVPIWRTDAFCEPDCDADAIQTQTFGFNRFIPCAGGVCKQPGDTYTQRSAYSPAFVGSWWWTDRPEPTKEQFEWMACMCEEYRLLRPYFSCDFYPLENCGWSYERDGWAAYRYDRPEHNDGVIIAFRRSGSCCTASSYVLEGLCHDGIYTVTDIDTNEMREIPGKTLVTEGLTVTIPNRRESKVIIYKLKTEK